MNIKKLIEKSEEQGFIAQLEAKTRHTYNLKIFNLDGVEIFCLNDIDLYDEIGLLKHYQFFK